MPFLVICELLGLPDEDRETFRQLGSARFDVSYGGQGIVRRGVRVAEVPDGGDRASSASDPGDGLIGQIIREHGDEINDFDLAGLADGVFTGGLETSASMLALGTAVLLDHPDDYRAGRHRPGGRGPDRRGAAALPLRRAGRVPALPQARRRGRPAGRCRRATW